MAQPHSEMVKAQVLASLLAGQSITQVAKQYDIPVGTVKRWSASRDEVVQSNRTTKSEIGELLLEYVRETLKTLIAQQKVFREPDYIRKQSASEVAVLHGVAADKAIRLLEALADNEEE